MSRAPRIAARLSVVLLAAAALTACQAQLVLEVSVDARGAGQVLVRLGADDALIEHAEQAGADPLGDLAAVGEDLAAAGWETSDVVTDDGGRQVTLATTFADPAEFNDLVSELADALAAPEVEPLQALRLDVDDDTNELALTGAAGLEPGPAVTELGLQPDQAVALLTEHDAFHYEIVATLPGELLTTTAGEADMPLRWDVAPGERVEIVAVTELPGGRWWVLGLLAAAAVALLGLGWALRAARRRRATNGPRALRRLSG